MKSPFLLALWVLALPILSHAQDRPNVLLITVDDLNDWVGCLGGHPQARTPNLDRLAERGVLFTNAHCNAPICNPSRVSFMTGIRPSTSGIYDNSHRFRKSPVLKDSVTMPQHFAQNGYLTMATGKLFHGSGSQEEFQVYGPAEGQGPSPKQKISIPKEISSSRLWDFGAYPEDESAAHDLMDARWAAEQLGQEQAKPFILGVGFYRPHVPLYAPPKWFNAFKPEDTVLPPVMEGDLNDIPEFGMKLHTNPLPPPHAWFVEKGQWKPAVAAYLASTYFMDHCLGVVMDALDASAHADNTWIVLFSDHGFFLGEKDRWAKQSVWERATKVPMIVVPPKNAEGFATNARCSRPMDLLSVYPTLIELCGLPTREELEGVNIMPLLKNPEAEWERPAITTYEQGNHGVRSERWRFIQYADGSEELYDHQKDPNEWSNLAPNPEYTAVLEEHRKWLPEVNVRPMAK